MWKCHRLLRFIQELNAPLLSAVWMLTLLLFYHPAFLPLLIILCAKMQIQFYKAPSSVASWSKTKKEILAASAGQGKRDSRRGGKWLTASKSYLRPLKQPSAKQKSFPSVQPHTEMTEKKFYKMLFVIHNAHIYVYVFACTHFFSISLVLKLSCEELGEIENLLLTVSLMYLLVWALIIIKRINACFPYSIKLLVLNSIKNEILIMSRNTQIWISCIYLTWEGWC